jgi:taurine transport system substrate-binding protein
MKTLTKFLTGTLLAAFAAQAASAADTVRIGYQNEPDPSHAAIVDGAYEKATGDKIEWRKFDSGASVIAALASTRLTLAMRAQARLPPA